MTERTLMHITPLPADHTPEHARELLLPFLLQCINWSHSSPELDGSVIDADDQLAAYIDGWGRDGDIAVIAWDDDDQPVGAAWCRLLSDPPGYGWVADDIPEVSIAVAPDFQAKGAGRQLLLDDVDLLGVQIRELALHGVADALLASTERKSPTNKSQNVGDDLAFVHLIVVHHDISFT